MKNGGQGVQAPGALRVTPDHAIILNLSFKLRNEEKRFYYFPVSPNQLHSCDRQIISSHDFKPPSYFYAKWQQLSKKIQC